MPRKTGSRRRDRELVQVYAWDEFALDEPEFLMGVVMEHHKREGNPENRLKVGEGGVKSFFPENGREHSIFVTGHGDVYSKVVSGADADVDADAEGGRHEHIVGNKLAALYGRASAAQEMHELVSRFDDQQRDVVTVLDAGPYETADELYKELSEAVPDVESDVIDLLQDRYGNVTDTEQETNGRNAMDYEKDTVYGEEMQEIYDNVVDVVRARL